MKKEIKKDQGCLHNNESDPWLMEKVNKKSKDKKFDIEKIFDHNHKPGKEVAVAKKEKKPYREGLAFSFMTREQGKIAPSYKKHIPFA